MAEVARPAAHGELDPRQRRGHDVTAAEGDHRIVTSTLERSEARLHGILTVGPSQGNLNAHI
jgi:hypothetical protein